MNGKADAQIICVDPALERANVQLLTGAHVKHLETDASGRVVTKVLAERDGQPEEYSGADCCGFMRSDQLRHTAAALGELQASERAREQFECGGAAL